MDFQTVERNIQSVFMFVRALFIFAQDMLKTGTRHQVIIRVNKKKKNPSIKELVHYKKLVSFKKKKKTELHFSNGADSKAAD